MGYIIDGLALAACIGAYRVYTDPRKSSVSSSWSCYKHLWLNIFRHSGDFVASSFLGLLCSYPDGGRKFVGNSAEIFNISGVRLMRFQDNLCSRAARYTFWSTFGKLGYIQRVTHVDPGKNSIFGSCRSWQNNIVFTTPHLINFVKDEASNKYLRTLCSIRDPFVGVLEGSASELLALLASAKENRRDITQDIRKGHVLDRKAQSSVPIIHQLRLDFESFLFFNSGPDPDRASYIEKALKAESEDGVLERLFPYLEAIVDCTGETISPESRSVLTRISPNIPIFVPYLRMSGRIVAINIGNDEFVLNPFLGELRLVGDDNLLSEGSSVSIVLGTETMSAILTGCQGAMYKIKIP